MALPAPLDVYQSCNGHDPYPLLLLVLQENEREALGLGFYEFLVRTMQAVLLHACPRQV